MPRRPLRNSLLRAAFVAALFAWGLLGWSDGAAARFRVPTVLVIRETALTNGNERLERFRAESAGEVYDRLADLRPEIGD